jgi:acyl-CoA synthetase (AMP-forming)/AMP-acid ligase II/acyl carrier protein
LRSSLWEKIEVRFGCSVYNMYGMTETVANATYAGRQPEMGPVGSIGFPVDCEVRLVDGNPSGAEHESAREGELQVRGENVFKGYWKDAERTVRTLTGDGWMRTGDLARRRDDGGLEIIGRISTVINMGGHSVIPEEIDEVLAAHPAVVDVATVGVSDPEFEEVAVSAVVLESPASEAQLTDHCRQRLEQLKVPKRILAVEKIPRGGAGKPKTPELRELLNPLLASKVVAPAMDDDRTVSVESVFELAARLFRVPVEELDANSSPETVKGWDSFNQLNLLIEAEHSFGIQIPASQVASIRTLGDLHQTITATH